ncbi:MAG: AAA family ATPase [Helicobacteraceae bacterium]|jgi:DNA transposition AAA+ family ATPase|nr:AAA family ATPase [Helicobacteraceae bacterium]
MDLREKFSQSGLTLKEAAIKLGKSPSTISDVINGKYVAKNAELYAAAIEKMCDERLTLAVASESFSGYWTAAQEAIKDRFERMIASKRSFFELVVGESGMGKTYLMTRFAKERKAIYVKARASQSASAFMSALLRAIDEKTYGATDDKLERFCEAIERGGYRMVIVDEADLFARDRDATAERKFELLREIYEFGKMRNLGITVVAVGLGNLKRRIEKLGGYLQSRITYSPEMIASTDELQRIGSIMGIGTGMSEFLAQGQNARLYEKAANNIALGYEERVAANLVYSVRR